MRSSLFLALTVLLAACASPGTVSVPDDHPASLSAAPSPHVVTVASLDPVRPPVLPAPLRPDGHPPAGSEAGMDHGATSHTPAATMEADEASMSHTARHHMSGRWGDDDDDAPEMTPAAGDLTATLDAYLAAQSALASDDLGAATSAARTLAEGLATLDASEAGAMRAHARALAGADDLASARVAFGKLSAPFVAFVEATGVPEDYDVARFSCGMFRDVPEGGVWLQRGDEVRNPYYGSAMLTCGSHDHAMPEMEHGAMPHLGGGSTDHSEMNHDHRP
ncbi:MAG: DUF3347 domain-containing protein [Rhodothermales bacterium]